MKTMKLLLMTVFMVVALSVVFAATDEEVCEYLVGSMLYIDNPDGAEWDFQHARELCGTDTNRFARLICEIARTNDSWIARGMIDNLGAYGTAEQLPFLYSQISNVTYGASAVRSILRIEGLASNSVAMVDSYLSMTNSNLLNRYYVCEDLVRKAYASYPVNDVCNRAKKLGLHFAADINVFHDWLDDVLKSVDSSYRSSKRRLSVMRAARARTTDSADLNYITNAINELVAYPEADLPE